MISRIQVSALVYCMRFFRALVLAIVVPLAALAQDVSLEFNIPAQPLASALERYGDATARNALYNSNLVIGRRSTAVQGMFSPEAALTRLLEGSGLSATPVTATSFALFAAPQGIKPLPPSAITNYYGRIQASLHDALCAAGAARPGNYRIGMRLWIDSAGNVMRDERINSTGLSDVDAAIDQALRHLAIGARPPAELAQPVSVVIVPQGPGVTMSCGNPGAGHDGASP